MGLPIAVKEFQDAIKDGKVKGCLCRGCGLKAVGVLAFCLRCGGGELEAVELPSVGRVLSYTIQQVAPETYLNETPYAWAIIELEGGVRMTGWIPNIQSPEDLTIGQRVKLTRSYKPGSVFEKLRDS